MSDRIKIDLAVDRAVHGEPPMPEWNEMRKEAALAYAMSEIEILRKNRDDLRDAYLEADANIERLNWLIAEGEKHFGTLWRDATYADIDAVRHPPAARGEGA